MTRIKAKDLRIMNKQERMKKLEELKLELIKAKVASSKAGGSKTKEIKRLVARLLTINKTQEEPK